MKNFTYYRPQTAEEAVGLLDDKWGTSELLAGGTDLLDLQKEYIAQPDKVISLSGVKGLSGIDTNGERVVIQAGTKLAEIAEHPELRKLYPGLTSAAQEIGGPQIRNMGTLGGNLCQRNRCWYFRDEPTVCLLKGGERCYAIDGENRYHAIFWQGHKCVIVNPSTLAPVLIALGAEVSTVAAGGGRKLPIDQFFQGPSSATEREHVLKPNELVVSVSIPKSGARNASYEVRHKQAYDWPLVQAGVAFAYEDNKASKVRIVLGHVAPMPRVAEEAAKALEGKEVTEETAAAAGKAAAEGAKPLSQNAYKVKLVEVAVKRAALTAAGQKRYWEA